VDVAATLGYEVADAHGARVGRVEGPLFGSLAEEPDAIAVRSGRLLHRHYIVPVEAIRFVDRRGRVIELRLDRKALTLFL
jgi:uncharacterized protein YrrD